MVESSAVSPNVTPRSLRQAAAEFRLSKTQTIDPPCENLKMSFVGGIGVEIQ